MLQLRTPTAPTLAGWHHAHTPTTQCMLARPAPTQARWQNAHTRTKNSLLPRPSPLEARWRRGPAFFHQTTLSQHCANRAVGGLTPDVTSETGSKIWLGKKLIAMSGTRQHAAGAPMHVEGTHTVGSKGA